MREMESKITVLLLSADSEIIEVSSGEISCMPHSDDRKM